MVTIFLDCVWCLVIWVYYVIAVIFLVLTWYNHRCSNKQSHGQSHSGSEQFSPSWGWNKRIWNQKGDHLWAMGIYDHIWASMTICGHVWPYADIHLWADQPVSPTAKLPHPIRRWVVVPSIRNKCLGDKNIAISDCSFKNMQNQVHVRQVAACTALPWLT